MCFILQSQAGIPWLFVMGLMLVVDLVAFSLTLTDFKYSEMSAEKFSCTLENWSSTRRDLTISSLALVFSRGGLLWLANLFLFISVLRLFLRLVNILFSLILSSNSLQIKKKVFLYKIILDIIIGKTFLKLFYFRHIQLILSCNQE